MQRTYPNATIAPMKARLSAVENPKPCFNMRDARPKKSQFNESRQVDISKRQIRTVRKKRSVSTRYIGVSKLVSCGSLICFSGSASTK